MNIIRSYKAVTGVTISFEIIVAVSGSLEIVTAVNINKVSFG